MTQEELQTKLKEQLDKLSPESIAQLKDTVKGEHGDLKKWRPRETQISAYLSPADELFYGGIAGAGKLQELNEYLITPDGFVKVADIHAGSVVYGRDGKPCNVLAESELVHGEAWKLTFDDGSEVTVHDDHLWLTYDYQELRRLLNSTEEWKAKRRAKRPSRSKIGAGNTTNHTDEHRRYLSEKIAERNRLMAKPLKPIPTGTVRTTKEIVETLKVRNRTNHGVPVVSAPLEMPERDLPLDPYILGYWLGNGTARCGAITTMDIEVVEYFESKGFTVSSSYNHEITTIGGETRDCLASRYSFDGLMPLLRELDVLNNKHVPEIYLYSSIEQRKQLLAGFMDSDGGNDGGGVSYSSCLKHLSDAVAFLARSLGHKATVTTKKSTLYGVEHQNRHVVLYTPKMQVFRIKRKADCINYGKRQTLDFRYIVSAERTEPVTMKCIQVDSPDKLYLITENLIPTHNSDLLLGLAMTQHNRSLIIRKNTTEVVDIVKRFKEINELGGKEWHWKHVGNGGEGTRTRDGQLDLIEISGCETPADMHKFRGRRHDLKGYDEVSEISEEVYRFINGWNRGVPNQRCRIVCASNPPVNTSGEWIIKRWAAWLDPSAGKLTPYGQLKWYSMIDGKEEEFPDGSEFEHGGYKLIPQSRTFIPGQMLQLLKDSGYQSRLAAMPEPYRTAYLTGNFAAARKDEENQVIPSAWVRMAQERWCDRMKNPGELMRAGYDVASSKNSGGDRACLAKYYENKVIGQIKTVPGTETPDGKSACKLMLAEGINGQVVVNVDAIGIGAAAHEVSEMMGLNVRALVVSNSTTWRDERIPKMKFPNIRSAMWWNLRCMLDPERGRPEDRLALPPDPAVMSDLTAPLFEITAGGIRVEPKDKIRERIGRSTDVGDAICMALFVGPKGLIVFA